MKGEPIEILAEDLGTSVRTIERDLQRAVERGWDTEVRDRLRESLKNAPDVHADIMATDVETLHKFAKGFKLKLDAVNSLTAGLGVFKTESKRTTETVSLAAIAAESAPDSGLTGISQPPRVTFELPAPTVDAEVLPSE